MTEYFYLVGCHVTRNGVSQRPVWLLWDTAHCGEMRLVMEVVSYSLSLSSLARLATWPPVSRENTQLDSDLAWPVSSDTGFVKLLPGLAAALTSKMKQPPLLVPARKRLGCSGWTDRDLGLSLSKQRRVRAGWAQPSLVSTMTTVPELPWLMRKVSGDCWAWQLVQPPDSRKVWSPYSICHCSAAQSSTREVPS